MNKWIMKNLLTIALVLLGIIFGGTVDNVFEAAFPKAGAASKEILREMMQDVIKEEIAPLKADIEEIKGQNQVLSIATFEEWVRFTEKQYTKIQRNRDDLSWSDVEYALGKWPILPDDYKTPDLCSKVEFLEMKYKEHINNGA